MIITPLGHTEFLVDIENNDNETVRILVDAWLSDYVIGDLMERSVKVRLDPSKVNTIDAICISHSHTDHLDPYTLVEIYRHAKPILLLPFTLAYLVPLLREYLGEIQVQVLSPGKPFFLKGIEITPYMFTQSEITNEDDVMMLGIASDRELLFAEIDTLPEDDDLDVQNVLYQILTRKDYETVLYLASRNELPGQLPLLDVSEKKRARFRSQYIASRKDEMYASYQKYEYEDYADFPNIYEIPGFTRGFIGQGIAYPRALCDEFFAIQIFPLDEIASMEADIARECGYEFTQKALLPGRQYKVENGMIEPGRKDCPIGQLIKNNEQGIIVKKDRIYANGPLFPRDLSDADVDDAKKRILEVLNTRFLPYWSASPVASLREALVKNGGNYRIGFMVSDFPSSPPEKGGGSPVSVANRGVLFGEREGVTKKGIPQSVTHPNPPFSGRGLERIIFEYSTTRSGCIEIPYEQGMKIDEDYWLLDVLDFLDGRQELYSNFWHKLDPKKIYRLWTCLGANFCNHDLVEKKYRLHFQRAKQGLLVNNFVEEIYSQLTV